MCDKQLFRQAEYGRFRCSNDIQSMSSLKPRSAEELHAAAVALQEKKEKEMKKGT